jgi:hypothetical protein
MEVAASIFRSPLAPLSAFEAIAERYPVYRIDPA